MPLRKQINFKARLQKRGRLKIPESLFAPYELEATQTLKVAINPQAIWSIPQSFYTRITKDRRIIIPKVILELLSSKPLPENCILEVTLEPT